MKLLFLVPAPRVKSERQMKEMEHRSGTFFSGLSDSLYASRIVEQQKQQHSSSSTAAVVAATSRQRRRRAPLWRVGLLSCVFVAERVLCASWLWAIHQQQRGFLQQQRTCYAAAAVMTTVVGGKEDPSPSDWNTLPSEPSDPSHCLLESSSRSAGCRVANSITENTMIDLKHSNLNFLQSFFTLHFFPSRKKYVNEWLFHEDSRSTKAMNSKNGGDSFRSR